METDLLEQDRIAEVIAGLYSNQKILDYKPPIHKAGKRIKATSTNSSSKTKHMAEMNDFLYMFINEEYSLVQGKPSIESILKKTLNANIAVSKETTENGKTRDELNNGITILKSHINNVKANNTDGSLDNELKKEKLN